MGLSPVNEQPIPDDLCARINYQEKNDLGLSGVMGRSSILRKVCFQPKHYFTALVGKYLVHFNLVLFLWLLGFFLLLRLLVLLLVLLTLLAHICVKFFKN